jgi:phosphoglycolate phosphatase-like HAD superfamily hydrolase
VTAPKVLALDFDGVICNTVREGLRSAWQVCREIRGGGDAIPPPEVGAAFVRLRPVLEVGWEFPVLLLALLDGVSDAVLLRDFQATWRQRILTKYHLTPADLESRFDSARDRVIQRSLTDWLSDQGPYPGVPDKLRTVLKEEVRIFVLTTKEKRFAHKLLEIHGVILPADQVWGKEQVHPKAELLRILRRENAVAFADIWFVEDRLKTLQSVEQQPDLTAVRLFLATWGYTTPTDREEAARDPRITPLTLEQFCGDFSGWTRSGVGSTP